MKSSNLRLLLQQRGSRRVFLASIVAAGFWSALIVSSAFVLARVIVSLINREENVLQLITMLASLWIVRALFQAIFEGWCSRQAASTKQEIRGDVTSSIESFAHIPPSILSTLLVKGLNSLDIYIGRFLPQLLFASSIPIVVIATLLILDPLSGVIAIITLPLIPLFGALIGKYTADSVNKKWKSMGTLSAYFEDSLRGFVTLKIFGRHKSQNKRIEAMGDQYTRETMKVLRISFLSALALELCATISVALIAVTVGLRLVDGRMDFTNALAVLILAPEVYFPLRNAASLFHASADGSEALNQLMGIRAKKLEEIAPKEVDFSEVDEISWQDWRLEIPGRAPSRIAGNTIKSGQIHFIVGESGIGKTSFALNLLGVRADAKLTIKTSQETITFDHSYAKSWFEHIGWIPQTPHLATGNLRDQFKLISSTITDSSIEKTLNRCGLEIEDLPDGFNTELGSRGEGGIQASGGQIRKIAVARALTSTPQVIIADEPTADLDTASAAKIMKALRGYATSGAIVICITHDLSLLRNEDSRQSFEAETFS